MLRWRGKPDSQDRRERVFFADEDGEALCPGDVAVMDDQKGHKLAGVWEAIEAAGARLLFIPP